MNTTYTPYVLILPFAPRRERRRLEARRGRRSKRQSCEALGAAPTTHARSEDHRSSRWSRWVSPCAIGERLRQAASRRFALPYRAPPCSGRAPRDSSHPTVLASPGSAGGRPTTRSASPTSEARSRPSRPAQMCARRWRGANDADEVVAKSQEAGSNRSV